MIAFHVADMTCNHCVSTINKAVKAVDPSARVDVDLASHQVTIQGAEVPPQALRDAIAEAGYTPLPATPTSETRAR